VRAQKRRKRNLNGRHCGKMGDMQSFMKQFAVLRAAMEMPASRENT
jgi:hypothetical protein